MHFGAPLRLQFFSNLSKCMSGLTMDFWSVRVQSNKEKKVMFKDTQCLAPCIFQQHINLAVQNIHLEYHVPLFTSCGTSEPSLCLLHSLFPYYHFSNSYVFALHTQVCISILLFSKTCIQHVMNWFKPVFCIVFPSVLMPSKKSISVYLMSFELLIKILTQKESRRCSL